MIEELEIDLIFVCVPYKQNDCQFTSRAQHILKIAVKSWSVEIDPFKGEVLYKYLRCLRVVKVKGV